MFGLFRRPKGSVNSRRCVPPATRVYAIGDVHGCLEALERLLTEITLDSASYTGRVILVMLGDLVDRGPESAGVIDRVLHRRLPGDEQHVLMGNHEEAILGVYQGSVEPRGWLSYGGLQTLESYGIDRTEHFARAFDLGRRMHEAIPVDHVDFLRSLPDQLRIGDYLFVHAGIRPGVPIEQQIPADLRWIRSGFLDSDADHGVTVVHGHSISSEPEAMANRIGIDTGCYAGGPLTALVLEGSGQRFLQVPGPTVA
ncbi:MAG: metallophosphoesterase family protein [Sphingomicrobium sp.]